MRYPAMLLLILAAALPVAAAGPGAAPSPPAAGAGGAVAPSGTEQPATSGLEAEIRALRHDVLEMHAELTAAETAFLFPASTRFTVFVSLDMPARFDLRAVELRLDDKVVAHHLYSERELHALQRGGKHRLYVSSIAPGLHELTAYFLGTDDKGRDYRRGVTRKFEKGTRPAFAELKIANLRSRRLPEMDVEVWE